MQKAQLDGKEIGKVGDLQIWEKDNQVVVFLEKGPAVILTPYGKKGIHVETEHKKIMVGITYGRGWNEPSLTIIE